MESYDNSIFWVGRRVNKDGVPNHWQRVDLGVHKITSPTVLVLGGNFTNNDRMANGYAKIVESMLGDFAGDVDILSVNYNNCGNYFSKILEDNIVKISKEVFLPLISKNGQRLSSDEACKNIRKLTIFAHCFGYNEVALGMQEMLFNLLNNLGYDSEETGKIVEQLFVISFGTEIKNDWFKSVNVVSPFDSSYYETSTQIWQELLASDFESCKFITEGDKAELKRISKLPIGEKEKTIKKFCEKNQRCFIVRHYNRLSLATSQIKDDVFNEHSLSEFARDKEWKSLGQLTASGEQTSKCLAVSLCTAVANSVENERRRELVPLDMDELETTLNGLVYGFNTQNTVPYGKEKM